MGFEVIQDRPPAGVLAQDNVHEAETFQRTRLFLLILMSAPLWTGKTTTPGQKLEESCSVEFSAVGDCHITKLREVDSERVRAKQLEEVDPVDLQTKRFEVSER